MWKKEIIISFISKFKQSDGKISMSVFKVLFSFSRSYQYLLSILKLWFSKFHLFLQRKCHFPRILCHPSSLMINHQRRRTRPWFVRVHSQSTFYMVTESHENTVTINTIFGNKCDETEKMFWKRRKYWKVSITLI